MWTVNMPVCLHSNQERGWWWWLPHTTGVICAAKPPFYPSLPPPPIGLQVGDMAGDTESCSMSSIVLCSIGLVDLPGLFLNWGAHGDILSFSRNTSFGGRLLDEYSFARISFACMLPNQYRYFGIHIYMLFHMESSWKTTPFYIQKRTMISKSALHTRWRGLDRSSIPFHQASKAGKSSTE